MMKNKDKDKDIGTEIIIGIVIGCFVFVLIIVIVIYLIRKFIYEYGDEKFSSSYDVNVGKIEVIYN